MSARRHFFTGFVRFLTRSPRAISIICRKLWRRLHKLSLRSLLIIVVLLTAAIVLLSKISSLHVGKVKAWWDDSWHYRVSVPLYLIGSTPYTDYQIKITVDTQSLIAAGKMQANCGDIRFTNASGTPLPYWVETGSFSCNKSNTTVWIKVDTIPSGNSTIYMYYGNPSAAPASNGNTTFIFFDGFDGTALDQTKWSYLDASGISVSGGYLHATSTSGWIQSIPTFDKSQNLIVDTSLINTTVPTNGYSPIGTWVSTANSFSTLIHPGSPTTLYYYNDGGWTALTGTNSINTLLVRQYLLSSGSNAIYYYNSTNLSSISYSTSVTNSVDNEPLRLIRRPDNLYTGQAMDAAWDYILVRKYAGTPSIGSFGTEEKGTGPLLYYDFDEAAGTTIHNRLENLSENGLVDWWKMDENTGTTVYDETKTANGTLSTTPPTWIAGKRGSALSFNGSSNYISYTTGPTLNYKPISISLWVYETASRFGTFFIGKSSYGGYLRDTGSGTYQWGLMNGTTEYTITSPIPSYNAWHHLVGTYDGAVQKLYVDGILQNSQGVSTVPTTTTDLGIGTCLFCGPSQFTNGYLDDVKVYNRVLADNEISAEYNSLQATMLNFGTAGVGATWVDGAPSPSNNHPQGKALTFNGTNQYAVTSSSSKLPFGSYPFSVSFWIKPKATADNRYIYLWGDTSTTTGTGNMMVYNPTTQSLSHNFWNRPLDTPSGSVPLDTWTRVTVTFNSTTRSIYLNGALAVTDTPTSVNVAPNYSLILGAYANGISPFSGALDEFKIYDYALTSSSIATEFPPDSGVHLDAGTRVSNPGTKNLFYWFKFDEGVGTSIVDSSPSHRTYNISNSGATPIWSANGRDGSKSLYFDGSDYVDLGNNIYSSMNDATIEGWFAYTGTYDTNRVIWSSYKDNNNRTPVFVNTSKKLVWEIFVGGINYSVTSTSDIPLGQWVHFALTCGAGGRKLYLNGTLEATLANNNCLSALGTTTVNHLGDHNGDSNYIGLEDNIKVYSRALSANEIGYESTNGQPFLYYDFSEGSGNIAYNKNPANWYDPGNAFNIPGLKHWWTFDQDAYFDSIYKDNVNPLNNGTPSGSPLPFNSDGAIADAVVIGNGTTSYVNVGDINDLSLPFSYTAWINLTSASSGWQTIFQTDSSASTYAGFWAQVNANLGIEINMGDNTTAGPTGRRSANTGNGVIPTSQWVHVAAVIRSATDMSLYVNGVSQALSYTGSGGATPVFLSNPGYIGIGSNNTSPFKGEIDELRMYNRALSTDEINTIMKATELHLAGHSYGWTSGAQKKSSQTNMDQALNLTSAGYAYNPNINSPSGANPISISYWVKPSTFSLNGSSSTIYWLNRNAMASNGNGSFCQSFSGSTSLCTPNNTLVANTWQNIIFTYDGTARTIYVDGKLITTDSVSYTNISRDGLVLGASYYHGSTNHYQSPLDEFRVFNYALTPADVQVEYNRGNATSLGIGQASNNPNLQVGTTSSLLAWYKMDDGSGMVISDSSGNEKTAVVGLSGVNAGVSSFTSGVFGKAFNFNGSTLLNVGNVLNLGTDARSYSVWVKTASDGTIFCKQQRGSPYLGYSLGISTGKVYADIIQNYGSNQFVAATGTTIITDNNWHHIVATYTPGNQIKLYVDDEPETLSVSSGSPGTWNTNNNYYFEIGNRGTDAGTSGGANFFSGLMDNLKIYNRVLSPAEIAFDYNQGKPLSHWSFNQTSGIMATNESGISPSNSGLMGYWPMEYLGKDYSGNNYDLSSGGSPSVVTGIRGGAVSVSGSSQYLYCSYSTCPGLDASTNGLTISSWIRNNASVGNTNTNMINKFYNSSPTNNGGYSLYYGSDGYVHLTLFNSAGTAVSGDANSSTSLPQNVWTHVIGKYDGSFIYIYINGVLKAKTAYTGGIKMTTTSSSFTVGGPASFFNGSFDHVKVWNRAINDNEIQMAYLSDERNAFLNGFPTDNSQWVSGKYGKALNTTAGTSINNNEAPYLAKLPQSTITAWIRPTVDGTSSIYSERSGYGSSFSVFQITRGSGGALSFSWKDASNAWNSISGTTILSRNVWYHIAAVFDTSGPKLYINGVLEGTSGATTTYTGALVTSLIADGFTGYIDEFKTYTYALTPDQIQVDMNNGAAVRLN